MNIRIWISIIIGWYEKNLARLSLVVGVYAVSLLLLKLPYLNIITIYIGFVPYFLAYLVCLKLFHLKSKQLILPAFAILGLAFVVYFVDKNIADGLTQLAYLLLGTYCIVALVFLHRTT